MAFTSIKNDNDRINKNLDLMTFEGRYMLGIPGPGNVKFQEDPFIRLQKNGANLRTNAIFIESDLLGLSKPLTTDCILYNSTIPPSKMISYGVELPYTEQSRAIMPAWTARTLTQNNFDYVFNNPQDHSMINFEHNTCSRIDEINKYNNKCL